ncbi:MAG TPA: S1 family peptidase [Bacteriovoracaceae bacterium]|nr:S1 family peptidase [Bacteriovoracaceae bacterium]
MKKLCILLAFFTFNAKAFIINGVPTKEYKAIVELRTVDFDSTHCTASMIKKGYFLTAAHCLLGRYDQTIIRDSIKINGIEFTDIKAVYNPLFYDAFWARDHRFDIAIIKVDPKIYREELQSFETLILAQRAPSTGDRVTMVGFGGNVCPVGGWATGLGTKRVGRNTIHRIDRGMCVTKGLTVPIQSADGSASIACIGDSGGPLLSSEGEILGVTSTGGYEVINGTLDNSLTYFANVMSPGNAVFISKMLEDQ